MLFEIPNISVKFDRDGQRVAAEAVCLMNWPMPDGTWTEQYRLMVVHDVRDPQWLDVPQTALYHVDGSLMPVWQLLSADDRNQYLYYRQKQQLGSRRAFFNTVGRHLRKGGQHVRA
ncbi:hypothetical protein G4Y79_20780 [Phototrophicus methaneseepsis]|uniref:Uncharacterized protein n=1 Tax=Phototrophicus methaneseepsis TaxID=2710758 RepID=A0A7S8IE14_9CHLR|nr:hypothetical protein [Phototrophicus methaneseepsis]QPC82092.1 hypothetical protein G4Y79_20780 [Phototrophicus methaneseepsis]